MGLGPNAHAQGVAGNRFFPRTLAFDDPAVTDELMVPDFSEATHPLDPGDRVDDRTYDASFAARLTPDLAVQGSLVWTQWSRPHQPLEQGYNTTSVGFKGRLYENDAREELLSASLNWALPYSGSSAVGADRPGSVQPGVFFGKGFGDLTGGWRWIRPVSLSGAILADLPTHRHSGELALDPVTNTLRLMTVADPYTVRWGVALEYSTLYLTDAMHGETSQEQPRRQWVPLVEFAFDSPLGPGGRRSATANPGLSYVRVAWQLAAEAIVPLDRSAGSGVGIRAQLVLFLDNLIPRLFAKPLLSERSIFSQPIGG
jgi:hypothetical protein